MPRRARPAGRRPDGDPAGGRGAVAALRAARQDRRAQRPRGAQHGHERRLRDRRPVRRDPRAGRQRAVRPARAEGAGRSGLVGHLLVERLRLARRAAPRAEREHPHDAHALAVGERQHVARTHPVVRLDDQEPVDADLAPGRVLRRQRAGLEEARLPEPAVEAQAVAARRRPRRVIRRRRGGRAARRTARLLTTARAGRGRAPPGAPLAPEVALLAVALETQRLDHPRQLGRREAGQRPELGRQRERPAARQRAQPRGEALDDVDAQADPAQPLEAERRRDAVGQPRGREGDAGRGGRGELGQAPMDRPQAGAQLDRARLRASPADRCGARRSARPGGSAARGRRRRARRARRAPRCCGRCPGPRPAGRRGRGRGRRDWPPAGGAAAARAPRGGRRASAPAAGARRPAPRRSGCRRAAARDAASARSRPAAGARPPPAASPRRDAR